MLTPMFLSFLHVFVTRPTGGRPALELVHVAEDQLERGPAPAGLVTKTGKKERNMGVSIGPNKKGQHVSPYPLPLDLLYESVARDWCLGAVKTFHNI